MQVEVLEARHGATFVLPCSGAPARRPARLPVPRPASARTPWPAVSTQQRVGDHGGAARFDPHGRRPLPSPSAAPESSDAVPTPSEPAPPRQPGSPRWLSPSSLAREVLRPFDAFPGVRGVMHIAAGPQSFPGLASPTRELAGSDSVQPASVVLSLRRRRPAPDRFPWRKAPTVRQCERPNQLRGPSQPPTRVARICCPALRFAPSSPPAAPATARDSARPRGFKQGDGQAAEPAMPANHPHGLHRPGSRSSFFGAHPLTANGPGTTDHFSPPSSSPANPSRAAVTDATSRVGAPEGLATPSAPARRSDRASQSDSPRGSAAEAFMAASGLTAVPAHNSPRSVGKGAALPSDLPALSL